MPNKSKKTTKYGRRYRKEWEKQPKLKAWIQPVVGDDSKAMCKFCKCEVRAHHGDLIQHVSTDEHKKSSQPCSSVRLTDLGVSCIIRGANTTREQELKYACFIACHCAISAVDHLGEMTAALYNQEIKLHRTKCRALICNVIAPSLTEDLVDDINKVSYSLIIDETTDITCTKHLCIMVRYFSQHFNRIICTFLGLIDLQWETADAISSSLLDFLKLLKIDFKSCIGIGTDGCNVMVGKHNSVYTKLKQVNPTLQLVKCVCHSLQLCASKAVQSLPHSLEFLVGRSYSWFSHSVQRQRNYKSIYRTINDGQDPLKLVHLSSTRWLAIHKCCERVLGQWDELKLHFDLCKVSERCYDAEILSNMYGDPVNKLYLQFLTPILQQFDKINQLFQSESGDHLKIQDDLLLFFRSLVSRFVIPSYIPPFDEGIVSLNLNDTSLFLPLAAIDFGALFTSSIQDLMLNDTVIQEVKNHCMGFLVEGAKQILLRLPENIRLWKSLSSFSPVAVLSQIKRPLSSLAIVKLYKGDLGLLDTQYRMINLIQWNIDDDATAEQLWQKAYQYKDASGERAFGELALFALAILSLPLSNADVERAFSQVNIIKSKLRNRMTNKTLAGILHVRYGMRRQNICCTDFKPTNCMLVRFNESMYQDNVDVGEEYDIVSYVRPISE